MASSEITKRKNKSKESSSDKLAEGNVTKPDQKKGDSNEKPKEPRFGALPKFANQRVWSRCVLLVGVVIYMWLFNRGGKETAFALQKDVHKHRSQPVECDAAFSLDIGRFPGCVPPKCGRFMTDELVTVSETEVLLRMAQRGIALGGSDGGASILDLHSGALSYGDKFINIYSFINEKKMDKIFTASDFTIYKIVKEKIRGTIAHIFKLERDSLHLMHPTFFSRLTNAEPRTPHDEYWHDHVDKDTYESFHYTALLYLSDHGVDFTGGRFMWLDSAGSANRPTVTNVTLEPRKGRVAVFTSGAENRHRVERVTTGTRYALTVAFTCDGARAIVGGDLTPR